MRITSKAGIAERFEGLRVLLAAFGLEGSGSLPVGGVRKGPPGLTIVLR
jgi:hypothetical protein